MSIEEFAAARDPLLRDIGERLRPGVQAGLASGGNDWYDLLQEMNQVFNEVYEAEGGTGDPSFAQGITILDSLERTQVSGQEAQEDRIVAWLATAVVGAATDLAAQRQSGKGVQWVTMEDERVRPVHAEAHGQTRRSGQAFDIGGFELQYPGQPVGPPEVWINCRCLLRVVDIADAMVAAGKEGTAMSQTIVEDEAPQIPEEDLALPVPWYGVLAPEGKWSGDRRRFAEGALRNRDLPLPLKYQATSDEGHKGSVVVGRIDRVWREGGEMRAEGVFDSSPHAYEAVRQIAERMIRGVSVDVDDAEGEMSDGSDGVPEGSLTFSSARISAATLVAIPAFSEAFVALGYWGEADDEGEFVVDEEGNEYVVLDDEEFAVWRPRMPKSKPRYTGPIGKRKQKGIARKNNSAIARRRRKIAAGRRNPTPRVRNAATADGVQVFMDDAGVEYVLVEDFAISEESWDGSAGRFSPAEWKRSCILHVCDGEEKSCHKLPIREPGGALSRRGVHAAASRLNQVDAPSDKVAAAKRALAAAYRQLGEEAPFAAETAEFDIPPAKTKDGPGWITHPRPTKEITGYWVDGKGRAKIGWGLPGDFNRCRSQLAKYVQNPDWLAGLCANLHYRALGIWPGQHRGEAALTAAGGPPPKDWFTDPRLAGPTAMQVTENGRIYGHLALWKSCHTAKGGCVRPPRSATNYAYFHTGEILTDSGPVPVGQITLGGGHASLSLGMQAAAEHYDNTGAAVADVVVGEDAHGIWFSGALRPSVTTEQVADLRAAALSGDWRDVDGAFEMIAALAVNVPGFPVPRISVATAGAHGYALTAAGVVTDESVAEFLLEKAALARTTLAVVKARRVLEDSRHGL